MNIVKDIFGSAFEIYSFLSKKSKVRNITKQLLIREIRNNIKILEHRNNRSVNRITLISKLDNSSILRAIEEGFDFNKLAPRRKVDEELVSVLKSSKRYFGWNAERIVASIDEKIFSLKELDELYDSIDTSSVNVTTRLNNLYYLLIIISVLMKKE